MVHDFGYHRILPQLVYEACDFRVEDEFFFGGGVGGDTVIDDPVAIGLIEEGENRHGSEKDE